MKLSTLFIRIGSQLMTRGYVKRAKEKGWTADQLRATRQIATREENCIWDTICGQILWNKGEQEIVAARLARRYDPGMTLNEVANRAIEIKKVVRREADPTGGLTPRQLAALEFQKRYLKGVVDRS